MKEVITTGSPDLERRTFACHSENWKAALALGREFGWQPRGAIPLPFSHLSRTDAEPVRDMSYTPAGFRRGFHQVDGEDAQAWRAALERCIGEVAAGRFQLPSIQSAVVLRAAMTPDQFRQANEAFACRSCARSWRSWRRGPSRSGRLAN